MTRIVRLAAMLSLSAAAPLAVHAQAPAGPPALPTWNIDVAHSEITFRIRHFMSRVSGTFTDWSGTIQADPAHWAGGGGLGVHQRGERGHPAGAARRRPSLGPVLQRRQLPDHHLRQPVRRPEGRLAHDHRRPHDARRHASRWSSRGRCSASCPANGRGPASRWRPRSTGWITAWPGTGCWRGAGRCSATTSRSGSTSRRSASRERPRAPAPGRQRPERIHRHAAGDDKADVAALLPSGRGALGDRSAAPRRASLRAPGTGAGRCSSSMTVPPRIDHPHHLHARIRPGHRRARPDLDPARREAVDQPDLPAQYPHRLLHRYHSPRRDSLVGEPVVFATASLARASSASRSAAAGGGAATRSSSLRLRPGGGVPGRREASAARGSPRPAAPRSAATWPRPGVCFLARLREPAQPGARWSWPAAWRRPLAGPVALLQLDGGRRWCPRPQYPAATATTMLAAQASVRTSGAGGAGRRRSAGAGGTTTTPTSRSASCWNARASASRAAQAAQPPTWSSRRDRSFGVELAVEQRLDGSLVRMRHACLPACDRPRPAGASPAKASSRPLPWRGPASRRFRRN